MYLKKRNLIITDIEDIKKKFLKDGIFYILDFSSNKLRYEKYIKSKKFLLINLPPKSDVNIRNITNFKNVIKTYNIYLTKLSKQLNKVHKKDYSVSYWELVIGNWLLKFISIINIRYNSINYVKKKYNINYILLPKQNIKNLKQCSSNDSLDFSRKIKTDTWNALIYHQIITNFFNIKITKFKPSEIKKPNSDIKNKFTVIEFFKNLYYYFKFKDTGKVFLYDNNISKKFILFLKLRFLDLPIINQSLFVKIFFRESRLRRNFELSRKKNKLHRLLNYLIPLHIPRVFIEGYKTSKQLIEKTNWPSNPRVIFSSAAFFNHDFFKIWTAKKREEGKTKFITMQHGSGYFFMKDFGPEYYQKKVSDKVIAWGDQKQKKIISGFNYKSTYDRNTKHNKHGKLVFVNYEQHKHIISTGGQIEADLRHNLYYDLVNSFFTNVKTEIVNSTIIKTQIASLHKDKVFFEKLKLDYEQNKKSLLDYFHQCRVFVIGKIVSTVFLETLNYNIPTIVFFDKKAEFFNSKAKTCVRRLQMAKIAFDDPIKAAIHINRIWRDVDKWWYCKKTQREVNFFCKFFSKKTKNPVNDAFKILQKEIL